MSENPDAEMLEFMAALECGLQEAVRGEGRVNTPEQIVARRSGGRPVQVVHKQPVTLRLDPEVLAHTCSGGAGGSSPCLTLTSHKLRVSCASTG